MNDNFLKNIGIFLFRIFIGAMMLYHGFAKIGIIFEGGAANWLNPLGIGSALSLYLSTIAEVGCSLLIILGVFLRPAALILAFNMYVAAFIFLADAGWVKQELAALYFGCYIFLLIVGGGEFSLSRRIFPDKFKTSNLGKFSQ